MLSGLYMKDPCHEMVSLLETQACALHSVFWLVQFALPCIRMCMCARSCRLHALHACCCPQPTSAVLLACRLHPAGALRDCIFEQEVRGTVVFSSLLNSKLTNTLFTPPPGALLCCCSDISQPSHCSVGQHPQLGEVTLRFFVNPVGETAAATAAAALLLCR
jgi:hypothetical protein